MRKALRRAELTVSLLSVGQERRDGDDALLPHAHPQQPFIHPGNQPANSHICVIGLHAVVTENQ